MAGLSAEHASGLIEKAVRAHNPTEAVLREAVTLDKELIRKKPRFQTLLPQVATFVENFSSLLLHEQDALNSLGDVCLLGCRAAQGDSERIECAMVLAHLMLHLCREIQREGVDRTRRDIPLRFEALLHGMNESFINKEFGDSLDPLLGSLFELGQQVILMAEEAESPEAWFDVLCSLNRLLIWRVYPQAPESDALDRNVASQALGELDELQRRIEEDESSCAEVFMDLACYEKQNHGN